MLNRIFPRIHRFHCPDEHQLVAYVDQQLIGAERERVESHLARCDSCLQQVGFLVKQSEMTAGAAPLALLQRAKKLETAARAITPFPWKPMSMAAAVALIAIALVVWREVRPHSQEQAVLVATAQRPGVPSIDNHANSAADNAVRSASPREFQPRVLFPQPGAIVRASDFSIRWDPIPNAAAYEVRIVTAGGDTVWRKRVHESSANPPSQILRPGMKYFVWVRAWLENGKTQQSTAVAFIGG